MSETAVMTVEDRLSRLEREMAELREERRVQPGRDDWKSVVGMFADDEMIKDIQSEGRRIRESERP